MRGGGGFKKKKLSLVYQVKLTRALRLVILVICQHARTWTKQGKVNRLTTISVNWVQDFLHMKKKKLRGKKGEKKEKEKKKGCPADGMKSPLTLKQSKLK